MYDAIKEGNTYYVLYTYYSEIRIDSIEEQDGTFKVTSSTLVRNQAEGETVTKGYLLILGDKVHAVFEYLIKTQEMWRLDGDKPVRLWRLDYKELDRQKKEAEKDSQKPEAEKEKIPPAEAPAPPPDTGNP